MNIRKRTGEVVPFQEEKILNAMKKAFFSQAQELDDRALDEMLSVVLKRLPENGGLTVERVQDEVERTLMEHGHYAVAKAYILYREKRAALRRVRAYLAREVEDDALEDLLRQIQKDFEEEVYPLSALQLKFESFCKPAMTTDAKMEALTKAAVELTTVEAPKWEFIAARLLNHTFSKRNASRWTERGVKGLYEKLRYLTDKGLTATISSPAIPVRRSTLRRAFYARSGTHCSPIPALTCCSSDTSSSPAAVSRWKRRRRCSWASRSTLP